MKKKLFVLAITAMMVLSCAVIVSVETSAYGQEVQPLICLDPIIAW